MSPKMKKTSLPVPVFEFATAARDYQRYATYIKSFRNPDPILNNTQEGKQKGIALFADMMSDPHVYSEFRRLRLSVVRYPFLVTPAGESVQDVEAADFCKAEIQRFYYDLVSYILSAIPVGFSVVEFWCEISDRVRIAKMKKRRQERFTFDSEGKLRLLTLESLQGIPVPPEQFIVAVFDEEDDNPFGEGVLSKCFWPWWFKKNGFLFWANFLERFGMPIALGTFPSGSPKDKQDDFLSALQAIQSDFAMIIPDGWKTELIEAQKTGATDSYENFQAFCERQISKAILGATINQGEQKYGTRSANETLKEISDEMIETAAEFASKVINEQLIPRICDWNFSLSAYPVFSIQYENKQISKEEAEKIEILSRAGLPVPADKIYDAQGWGIPGDDDLVMYNGKMIRYGDIPRINSQSLMPVSFGEAGEKKNAMNSRMIDRMDAYMDDLYESARPGLEKASSTGEAIDLVVNAGSFDAALDAIDKFDPGDLQREWESIMTLGRLLGYYSAQRQIAEAEFAEEIDWDDLFVKVKPDQAIQWIRDKIPVQKREWEKLSGAARNAAFYVSGLDKLSMINAVKEKILDALESGKTYRQFAKELAEQSGAVPFFASMETAFYTNLHQAMTAQECSDLDRVKDKLPYRRYVPVMDSKTRPEHAAARNTVARWDDPVWTILYEYLMDFNCRCRIVVATEQEYEGLGDKEAEDARYAVGEKFNPRVVQQDMNALRESLQDKDQYAEYLNGAIRSWFGLERPMIESMENLPEPPPKLETGKSIEYYWNELGKALKQDGDIYRIDLPKTSSEQIVTRDALSHILGKTERETNLLMLAECKDPFEVWEFTRDGKTFGLRVITVFKSGKKVNAGIGVFLDGQFQTFIPSTSPYAINKYRKGKFIYGK